MNIVSAPSLFDKLNGIDINLKNCFDESTVSFITEIQKLDKNLYGDIGADHWIIYTFGSKAGFMPAITKDNDIISYSQVVGCIEGDKAQLWGLGTKKSYQQKGLGTLTFETTKEICRKLDKNKLEINVEPENVSNKIYCKDKPEILSFGKFYPNESPRNILSVSLNSNNDPFIDSEFKINAYDYKKMKRVSSSPRKKYLLDWMIEDETPYLIIGLNE